MKLFALLGVLGTLAVAMAAAGTHTATYAGPTSTALRPPERR
jgi:hypothetical protein